MKKLGLVVIASLILSGCNRLDNHQPLGSVRLMFAKTNVIAQTFLSSRNNLNMVYICLRNPNRSLIPLRFSLKDESGKVLRQIDLSGGNIDNSDCTRFQFDPIDSSANQRYSAEIATNLSPDLTKLEEAGLRSGLYAEAHPGGDYLLGEASLDGVIAPYDLHFKTLYRQAFREVVKEAWSQLLIRLTKDPFFGIFFLLLLGFTISQSKQAK